MNRLRRAPWEVLIALDQLASALTLGSADETLSSRCWKARLKGKLKGRVAVWLIDRLFFVLTLGKVANHCRDSVERDEGGMTWDGVGRG